MEEELVRACRNSDEVWSEKGRTKREIGSGFCWRWEGERKWVVSAGGDHAGLWLLVSTVVLEVHRRWVAGRGGWQPELAGKKEIGKRVRERLEEVENRGVPLLAHFTGEIRQQQCDADRRERDEGEGRG
ncbi:hypothetical protein HAX54_051748 [Datura stramonium]|uniref:Uncharacterized protein n=1 Tax=Datura stramonium TaxID=4076 RepID=A0ABS8SY18_DATST|nr:hypothetical protein [Datura stramonium]